MRVGTFALTHLTGDRPVRDALRQLMTDPEYCGFGWTELKHAKAVQLYRMCGAGVATVFPGLGRFLLLHPRSCAPSPLLCPVFCVSVRTEH